MSYYTKFEYCEKQLKRGRNGRKQVYSYHYMQYADVNRDKIVFYWHELSPERVYATLTKDNLLTLENQYLTSVWLQNRVWELFSIRIYSDAANHRTSTHKVRLSMRRGYYGGRPSTSLPFIQGMQFQDGKLLDEEKYRAMDTVIRTDRAKAKAARQRIHKLVALCKVVDKMGGHRPEFNDDNNWTGEELRDAKLDFFNLEQPTMFDVDKVLAVGDPWNWQWWRNNQNQPWARDRTPSSFKYGLKKLEKLALEAEGAKYVTNKERTE